jgi:hypothetical protein
MRIHVPVPEDRREAGAAPGQRTGRRGLIGVIDNSKPRFEVVARSALETLAARGFSHTDEVYVRKPSPTRPAEAGELDRLANGTVAVLIGSGD